MQILITPATAIKPGRMVLNILQALAGSRLHAPEAGVSSGRCEKIAAFPGDLFCWIVMGTKTGNVFTASDPCPPVKFTFFLSWQHQLNVCRNSPAQMRHRPAVQIQAVPVHGK